MKNKNTKSGYIALMTSIFISIILLTITVKQNSLGWDTSFNILMSESKQQSESLAHICVDTAIASFLNNSYKENITEYPNGKCTNFPILDNNPSIGFMKIKTTAVVKNSYTNIEAITSKNQKMKIISYKEIPFLE